MLFCRVGDVLKEMEAIQKKEAEDTAALENMVQQVEANLVTTTVRLWSSNCHIIPQEILYSNLLISSVTFIFKKAVLLLNIFKDSGDLLLLRCQSAFVY